MAARRRAVPAVIPVEGGVGSADVTKSRVRVVIRRPELDDAAGRVVTGRHGGGVRTDGQVGDLLLEEVAARRDGELVDVLRERIHRRPDPDRILTRLLQKHVITDSVQAAARLLEGLTVVGDQVHVIRTEVSIGDPHIHAPIRFHAQIRCCDKLEAGQIGRRNRPDNLLGAVLLHNGGLVLVGKTRILGLAKTDEDIELAPRPLPGILLERPVRRLGIPADLRPDADPELVSVVAESVDRPQCLLRAIVVNLHRTVSRGRRVAVDHRVVEVEEVVAAESVGVAAVVARPELDVAVVERPVRYALDVGANLEVVDLLLEVTALARNRHAERREIERHRVERRPYVLLDARLLQDHAVRDAIEGRRLIERRTHVGDVRTVEIAQYGNVDVRDKPVVVRQVADQGGHFLRHVLARRHGHIGGIERIAGIVAQALRRQRRTVRHRRGEGHVDDPLVRQNVRRNRRHAAGREGDLRQPRHDDVLVERHAHGPTVDGENPGGLEDGSLRIFNRLHENHHPRVIVRNGIVRPGPVGIPARGRVVANA